ncbi:MAG TPA: S9 family peptidase [Pyrinomonadaceae bacterium]|nr:S9 family peptidase [Pyrinomonadaceae bacterium]
MKKSALAFLVLVILYFSASAQPYTIQQYLSIRSAGSPTFSPDGNRIAYLTNVSGTSQVWTTDLTGAAPKQLTNYEDNVGFVRWLPDGSGLIFGKARGGDENTQFFWMKTDGSGVRPLTDDPKVRNNFAEVSSDGKTIYYTSNKRNRTFFDVYSMDIASGKEELLYQYDGNADVAAVNDAGTKIVISRDGVEKSLDNDLYLVDVASKKEVHLTPHTDASEFGNVNFLADGLLFTTNDKRDFQGLAQMRKTNAAGDDWSAANRETKIVHEAAWDVSGVEMQPYGGVIAYTVNREGFSEIWLRKIETGGKPLISTISKTAERIDTLPERGTVGGMTLSKDQSKLAFSFSSSKYNGDIWLYDLKTRALKQLTQSDRAGIPQESFVAPKLVRWKSFDGLDVSGWYYLPVNAGNVYQIAAKGTQSISFGRYSVPPKRPAGPGDRFYILEDGKKIPVIVSVHGGPEGQERPGFNPLYQYYLSRGYAVLAPNVRGSTGYGKVYTHLDDVKNRENSVKDLAYAAQWLVTNGSADPKRIAVMGGSYGGYMTLAAITLYPELWAAAVDTVGIVNWESFLKNTSGYRRRQREVEYGMLDRDIDFLRAISPIKKIDRIKAPLFVIQGKNDPRVPYTEAEQVVKALKDRGAVVEYKLYDDEGHGISKLKNRLELYPLVADFLDRYMK